VKARLNLLKHHSLLSRAGKDSKGRISNDRRDIDYLLAMDKIPIGKREVL
jgi:hypothetical protein